MKDYILAVGIGVLLVVSLGEYLQVSSLQEQVSTLQNQVQGIPALSGQLQQQSQALQQIQQQARSIDSEVAALSGKITSFEVMDSCISVDTSCQAGASHSAFAVTLANNGTVIIPTSSFVVTLSALPNETNGFKGFSFNTFSPLIPEGPTVSYNLPSWQTVTNSTGSFYTGEVVHLSICLPNVACVQYTDIVRA